MDVINLGAAEGEGLVRGGAWGGVQAGWQVSLGAPRPVRAAGGRNGLKHTGPGLCQRGQVRKTGSKTRGFCEMPGLGVQLAGLAGASFPEDSRWDRRVGGLLRLGTQTHSRQGPSGGPRAQAGEVGVGHGYPRMGRGQGLQETSARNCGSACVHGREGTRGSSL